MRKLLSIQLPWHEVVVYRQRDGDKVSYRVRQSRSHHGQYATLKEAAYAASFALYGNADKLEVIAQLLEAAERQIN